MLPRLALDCSDGVAALALYSIPTVYGLYQGREPSFNLSGITAGSADLPIDVLINNDNAAEVTAVGVNGRSVTWGAPAFWGGRISSWVAIIPAAELVKAGPLQIQAIADGKCLYADISVVDDGPGRPEIEVAPTDLPLAADRDAVSVSGTNLGVADAGLATVTSHLVLWRDIAHFGAPPWTPLLTGTTGDALIYQVNTQVDGSRGASVFAVAGNWVHARVVGTDPVPDIVAANPSVLPLGPDPTSFVTVTFTARERFSSFTRIRAGHDATDQRLLDECRVYAETCQVAVPASLLSRAGPLTFAATTPGVASGSPLMVPVENPTPLVFANGELRFTVLATEDQPIYFSGAGLVATGDPSQLSYVEELTTGMRLSSAWAYGNLRAQVPPALVTRTGTLRFRVVNPGGVSGTALVSNPLDGEVVTAPWVAQVTPAAIPAAATSVRISLVGTNLDPQPDLTDVTIEVVIPDGAPALVPPDFGGVMYATPSARSGTDWSFEFPAQYASSVYAGTWSAQILIGGAANQRSNIVHFDVQ